MSEVLDEWVAKAEENYISALDLRGESEAASLVWSVINANKVQKSISRHSWCAIKVLFPRRTT